MRTRDLALYISRKSGRGQPLSWRVRAMLSTLLLLFISFALAFSIVLIESMAQGLDDVLQLLGGGSVIAYDRPDDGLLGSDGAWTMTTSFHVEAVRLISKPSTTPHRLKVSRYPGCSPSIWPWRLATASQ